MKGWQMFVHSVRLVFANLGAAFRVSAVLYLVQTVIQYFVQRATMTMQMTAMDPDAMANAMQGGLTAFVFAVIAMVFSMWIAIAWHRYVLLEEVPQGWLPLWPGGKLLGYFGRSLLIALIIGLVIFAINLIGALFVAFVPVLAPLLAFVSIGFAAILFFRLSPILPATALGQPLRLGEAWNATRGDSGSFLILALLTVVAAFIIQLPTLISGDPFSPISTIYGAVVGWFATIVGISLLTTIYGHYIERRGID